MTGDSLLLEMMQGKRSLEDLAEWLFLSYVGKWDDEQVLTLMANSFQTTHQLKADMYAKYVKTFQQKLHIPARH
jgi:hypothetical protein